MRGHKEFKRRKTTKRCVYSGKDINGHQVIIARYAIEYVKKQGYMVSDFKIQ